MTTCFGISAEYHRFRGNATSVRTERLAPLVALAGQHGCTLNEKSVVASVADLPVQLHGAVVVAMTAGEYGGLRVLAATVRKLLARGAGKVVAGDMGGDLIPLLPVLSTMCQGISTEYWRAEAAEKALAAAEKQHLAMIEKLARSVQIKAIKPIAELTRSLVAEAVEELETKAAERAEPEVSELQRNYRDAGIGVR